MRRSSFSSTSGFTLGARVAYRVYIEGARDGEILRGWTRRSSPQLSRALGKAFVILGGRRPQRARDHLDALRERHPEARGLCLLDRDGGEAEVQVGEGLEAFSWSRRHIESYLLVPDALRRARRFDRNQADLLDRLIAEHIPPAGDPAWSSLDAKRLLSRKGPFARELGTAFAPGRLARGMHQHELTSEVHELLGRLGDGLGIPLRGPEVQIRRT